MSGQLYERVVRLEIGPAAGGAGFAIEGLRIVFQVQKTEKRTPNAIRVQVYNLSEATRGRIHEVNSQLILHAGYRDAGGLQVIGRGQLTRAVHRFQPPDIVTEIEAGDGIGPCREVRVSLSYAPGCRGRQILADIAKQMGTPLRDLKGVTDRAWAQGFAFCGQSGEALDQVTAGMGASWSIQNGQLQVVKGGGMAARRAPLLAPDSGLIGSPEPISDVGESVEKATKRRGWRFRSLLRPEIEPGGPIVLQARAVKGTFRVVSCSHSGDTHGDEWNTEGECADPKLSGKVAA